MEGVERETDGVVWASMMLAASQRERNPAAERYWRVVVAAESLRLVQSVNALPPSERPIGWDPE